MKFIDKWERKYGRFGIPNLTVHYCLLRDWLCAYDHKSKPSELAESGTGVYFAWTDMETGDMGFVSAKYCRSTLVCDCGFILLLSDRNVTGAYDWYL